jgi:hypothetical protein
MKLSKRTINALLEMGFKRLKLKPNPRRTFLLLTPKSARACLAMSGYAMTYHQLNPLELLTFVKKQYINQVSDVVPALHACEALTLIRTNNRLVQYALIRMGVLKEDKDVLQTVLLYCTFGLGALRALMVDIRINYTENFLRGGNAW